MDPYRSAYDLVVGPKLVALSRAQRCFREAARLERTVRANRLARISAGLVGVVGGLAMYAVSAMRIGYIGSIDSSPLALTGPSILEFTLVAVGATYAAVRLVAHAVGTLRAKSAARSPKLEGDAEEDSARIDRTIERMRRSPTLVAKLDPDAARLYEADSFAAVGILIMFYLVAVTSLAGLVFIGPSFLVARALILRECRRS